MSNVEDAQETGAGVPRRTIVKGAAWSMPVIAAAVALPTASASVGGVIAFAEPEYVARPNGTYVVTGTVNVQPGAPLPADVALTYPPGFAGPASAPVDALGGFTVSGIVAPGTATTGVLTASAPGLTSGTTSLVVEVNVAPDPVDGIVWGENLGNTLFVTGGGVLKFATVPTHLNGPGTLGAGEIVAMAGGYRDHNSYLIRSDNTLWSHGAGSNATAPGTNATNAAAFNFSGLLHPDEKLVDVAGFTGGGYVLTSAGRVFSWGFNSGTGSLGNGTFGPDTNAPKLVSFPSGVFVTQISASYTGGIALDSTGQVWAWGINDQQDTGTQSTGNVNVPKPVVHQNGTPVTGASQIRGRFKGGMALVGDRVLSWGTNSGGQLGNGTTSGTRGYADHVLTSAGTPLSGIVKLPVFYHEAYHAAALAGDGTLYTWGYGSYNVHTPANTSSRPFAQPYGGTLPAGRIVDVSLSYYAIHILLEDGTIWSWGDNDYSAGADGTSGGIKKDPVRALVNPTTPVQASGFFPASHGGVFAYA
ncbi:RCC1 domain-containing protein [Microbacterium sp. No. 7]|uniref:RCC1 domain-containing protein n=1 Tax=Microbacterium sp. No. 7 TaxID=1714373 RepID=UPI0006D0FDC0|nr:hypothetical protein [Microbacterium sp. No. 7]